MPYCLIHVNAAMVTRQTETGSIVITPFPGAIETKPGSATVPFFGIQPAILDPTTGKVCASWRWLSGLVGTCWNLCFQELEGNGVEGVLVLKQPWPSIARSVYNDHKRCVNWCRLVYIPF